MTITLRDVSKYDDKPVPYASYDAGIVRVYDGTDPDPLFPLHKNGFISSSKPWWPYSFYDWYYWARPQVQAALKLLGADQGALSLAFDMEEWKTWDAKNQVWIEHKYPPRLNLLAGMHDLYDEYKIATGKLPQFYMNVGGILYLEPLPAWLTDCWLWVADWRKAPAPGLGGPNGWKKAEFWQQQGDPDLSIFMGTDDEFKALINPTPTPQPVLTDHDLLAEVVAWAKDQGFEP